MKLIGKIFFLVLLLVIISPILVLGYFGFIPGLSNLFGSNKPRDLKVRYTEEDHQSARAKSKIEYGELPADTAASVSLVRTGSRPVNFEMTSSEATSLMNNRPWKYFPYNDVQVKFNADGSAEVSGMILKDRVPGYGAFIGVPKEALDFAMKFLPVNPVFYLKMKASLVNNQVAIFEPQAFEIGRMPLPVSVFLSLAPKIVPEVYAIDIAGMGKELAKVSDKKALIISYINSRLSQTKGFYAKSAYFSADKLFFDGSLAEKESTVR
jgi:hypothetical protein